jgi:inner membrane protein
MRHSATARLLIMSVLTAALLVPVGLVYSTVQERASRRDSAVNEISGTWGGRQTLSGPVLTVPYVYSTTDHAGARREVTAFAHMLPRELDVNGALDTSRRRRGIFDVVVYRGEFTVRGRFRPGSLDWVKPAAERVDWSAATVSVGLSDPRGLSRRTVLTWRTREVPFEGSVPNVGLFASGIHARLGETTAPAADADIPFSFMLSVNGTHDFRLLPAAAETTVALRASWLHPSFTGGPLPEQWEAAGQGFSARWRVPDFGRTYAARWVGHDINPEQLQSRAAASAFGVALIQPVDIYQQAERAVKYAVLFIVLTFLMFFLWEILQATLLHPVQYAFVGFALCVFYLLLVSISEHFGFNVAYAVSSMAIVLLIGGYARAVLRGRRQALSVTAALCALYGFLYLLLQLEDFALLAGSVGLLLILAALMYATRRMDWYEIRLGGRQPGDAATPSVR